MSRQLGSEVSIAGERNFSLNSDERSITYSFSSHLDILEHVREVTGLNICEWASNNGIARVVVYQSAVGSGSRRGRVMLAKLLGKFPSEVWPKRSRRVKRMDDEAYRQTLTKQGGVP
jgi:lambda repressor-like predicted transcriptional regulator